METGDKITFLRTDHVGTIVSVIKRSLWTDVEVRHNIDGLENPATFTARNLMKTARVIPSDFCDFSRHDFKRPSYNTYEVNFRPLNEPKRLWCSTLIVHATSRKKVEDIATRGGRAEIIIESICKI